MKTGVTDGSGSLLSELNNDKRRRVRFADARVLSGMSKINLLGILSCDRLLAAKAPKESAMADWVIVLPPVQSGECNSNELHFEAPGSNFWSQDPSEGLS